KIKGSVVASGQTRPGKLLAMDSGMASGKIEGEATKEPAFGLDAWWIEPSLRQRAEAMNFTVVDPTSVLGTHLTEVVKLHAGDLLTREEATTSSSKSSRSPRRSSRRRTPAPARWGTFRKDSS